MIISDLSVTLTFWPMPAWRYGTQRRGDDVDPASMAVWLTK